MLGIGRRLICLSVLVLVRNWNLFDYTTSKGGLDYAGIFLECRDKSLTIRFSNIAQGTHTSAPAVDSINLGKWLE